MTDDSPATSVGSLGARHAGKTSRNFEGRAETQKIAASLNAHPSEQAGLSTNASRSRSRRLSRQSVCHCCASGERKW